MRIPLIALALLAALPSPAGAEATVGAATVEAARYPWLADWPAPLPVMVPLEARFAPPAGFARVEVAPESFAGWLRGLPLRTDRTNVLAYDGRRLLRPSAAVAVLDVGARDVQQCADTALRLHAEWLWHRGAADRAVYHFTSGDRSSWRDWKAGERFRVAGSRVERYRGAKRAGTRAAWRAWLDHLFRYAGTRSLRLDAAPVGERPFVAGDVLVQPGGPGHAVILLDLARHPDGRVAALIGQGFMPAEELHVLTMPGALDGVWFVLPAGPDEAVLTPSWPTPFRRAHALRFRDPR
ncbi:MAG: hypothetical protein H6703_13370 [Myxococcales bacterium]|nr:hypothetical protein [Myxococcales bacterium]MCB9543421.1 hypothetical protein [Myxococcales bacterium]